MNEDALIDSLAQTLLDEHQALHPTMQAGEFRNRLGDVFRKLRALNVPWSKILSLIGPIIQILLTGSGWGAILAAILALFNLPASAVTED